MRMSGQVHVPVVLHPEEEIPLLAAPEACLRVMARGRFRARNQTADLLERITMHLCNGTVPAIHNSVCVNSYFKWRQKKQNTPLRICCSHCPKLFRKCSFQATVILVGKAS